MKLVMDEKLKHRLVGVSVVLSLGAIFLPAMMKKSSQKLENNFSVNVQLPPKPAAPNVAVTDEEAMFKTIKIAKVAKVNIPTDSQEHNLPITADKREKIKSGSVDDESVEIMPVAQREAPTSATIEKPIELALNSAAQTVVRKEVKSIANKPVKIPAQSMPTAKAVAVTRSGSAVVHSHETKTPAKTVMTPAVISKQVMKREIYAVQLASFANVTNAQALVHKLKNKGYKASYARVAGKNGAIYKVYVGHSPIRDNVVKLKTQLASAMQLNGFVVNTGVS